MAEAIVTQESPTQVEVVHRNSVSLTVTDFKADTQAITAGTNIKQIEVGVPGFQGPKGDNGVAQRISSTSSTTAVVSPNVTRTFVLDTPLDLSPGDYIKVTRTGSSSNANYWMSGPITAISPTSVTILTDAAGLGGSFSGWRISVGGSKGSTGATGADGAKGDSFRIRTTSPTTQTLSSTFNGASRTFALDQPIDLAVGQFIRVWSTVNGGNQFTGTITAISSTELTMVVNGWSGNATLSSWNISMAGVTGNQGIQGIKGDTGTQGPIGPDGVQGPQGVQGVKGDTGSQGLKGDTGETGLTGPTGPKGADSTVAGPQGITGAKGDKGDTGNTGAKGDQGIQGIQGVAGSVGATGATGPQGVKGDQGNPGVAGPAGQKFRGNWSSSIDYDANDLVAYQGSAWFAATNPPLGEVPSMSSTYWFLYAQKGDQGVQGIQGNTGATGNTGPTGPQGIQGVKGDTGAAGTAGAKGDTGSQGIQGVKGDQGIQGVAGVKGDTGTTGATGPKGDTGNQGIQGIKGDTGSQGIQGTAGTKGDTGLAGVRGSRIYRPSAENNFWHTGITDAMPGDIFIDTENLIWECRTGSTFSYTGQSIQGDMGDVGPQGPKGDTGAASTVAGPQGIQGLKGDTGTTGATGPKGDTGTAGAKGDTGSQGIQGIQGLKGDTGTAGAAGAKGDTGATGPQGIQGIQGVKGDTGTKGDTGASAPNVIYPEVVGKTLVAGQPVYSEGDSLGAVYPAGNTDPYTTRLAADTGGTITNKNVPGSWWMDVASRMWREQRPALPADSVVLLNGGSNSAINTDGRLANYQAEKEACKAAIYLACVDGSTPVSNWVVSGTSFTFSNPALRDGAGLASSDAPGVYAKQTPIAGDWLGLGFSLADNGEAVGYDSGEWSVGGKVVSNSTVIRQQLTGNNENAGYGIRPVPLIGLDGNTEVRTTRRAVAYSVYAGLMRLVDTPPRIVVTLPPTPAWFTTDSQKARFKDYRRLAREAVAEVLSEYPALRGRLVVSNPQGDGYNAATMTIEDATHLNPTGASLLHHLALRALSLTTGGGASTAGKTGTRGSKWYRPDASNGYWHAGITDAQARDNFLAIDGFIWEYDGTAWIHTGQTLKGDKGDTGPAGKDGVGTSAPVAANRLTRQGSVLKLDGVTTRIAGPNAYWLALNDNVLDNGLPTYPTSGVVNQTLDAAKAMGANSVRVHTIGISLGKPRTIMPTLDTYDAVAFDKADYIIAAAKERGLLLSVPLTDRWDYYHGGAQSLINMVMPSGQRQLYRFWSEQTVRDAFDRYVTTLLNHVNPYTGLRWGDDPTLAMWEVGNEFYDLRNEQSSRDRHASIAALIKTLAPKALVVDGTGASGGRTIDSPGITDPNVDILTNHYYQDHAMDLNWLSGDATAAANANKVFMVGEYDWTDGNNGQADQNISVTRTQWLSAIESNPNIAGDYWWTLMVPAAGIHRDKYELYVPPENAEQAAGQASFTAHSKIMVPAKTVSGANVFVQNSKPTSSGPYLWIETNVGYNGDGFTFWIEDGK